MPWSAMAGSLLTVAGGALGSAFSGNHGGGGGKTTSTSTTEPWWSQAQRLNNEIYPAASGIYAKGPAQYYPDQTVAGQSPQTLEALSRQTERATSGNPLTSAGQAEFGKTIAGDYLNMDSNPYLKSALNNVMGDVQSRVAGTFGTKGGNNYGSSAHQEWLGRNLMEAASPLLNQNYQTERGRQLNAAQLAPSMASADYADLDRLKQAGQTTDAYQQSLIDANKARFDFQQSAPWDALSKYQAILQGNVGNQTTTTQPYFGANPYLNALGTGLSAYSLFNQNPAYNQNQNQQPQQLAGNSASYNSQGSFQPYYNGYDEYGGGPAYG